MLFTYEQLKVVHQAGLRGVENFDKLLIDEFRDKSPIEDAHFTVRLYNAFRRAGILTIGQARESLDHREPASSWAMTHALDLPGIGWGSYEAGRAALEDFDLRFVRDLKDGWVD